MPLHITKIFYLHTKKYSFFPGATSKLAVVTPAASFLRLMQKQSVSANKTTKTLLCD